MTSNEFIKYHEDFTSRMREIVAKKNHDYSGGDTDAFKNFKMVEGLEICSPEQGFLTRITDKLSRIINFMKTNNLQVKDESVEDTLLDLANYVILLAGYIKSKKNEELKETMSVFNMMQLKEGFESALRYGDQIAIRYMRKVFDKVK